VVLFDEIEKAHPELYNLLLGILEDGSMTDSHGRRADFRHAIIIMTSNIGSEGFGKERPLGFANIDQPKSEKEQASVLRELKTHFRPELINRIDEVVVFERLKREDLYKITHKMLAEVLARIREAGFHLTLGEGIAEHLAELGYSEEYGARELRRAVLRHFEDRFSLAVVEGRLTQGVPAAAELRDGEIAFLPLSDRAGLPTA
jgi:ATP-dependent Clp protease ATP-binding subunit ClpC